MSALQFAAGPGNDAVFLRLASITKSTRRGIRQGFFQYGPALVREAKRQILFKPKKGRTYRIRRGNRIIRHVASAPGETAANLTGKYKKTVDFKLKGSDSMVFGAGSTAVPYAVYLEKGTRRMAARPGLQNTLLALGNIGTNYLESEIEKALIK